MSDSPTREERYLSEARGANRNGVRRLLDEGVDINYTDSQGRNALFGLGLWKTLDLLIERGINVNQQNKRGETPLMVANDNTIIEKLLNAGADASLVDVRGRNVLWYHQNSSKFVDLIRAGADVNVHDGEGNCLLHNCGDTGIAQALIEAGIDVNHRNNGGVPPIKTVGSRVFNLLLDHGADVNFVDNNGQTMLFANTRDERTVATLLAHGIDPLHRDNDGHMAIYYCGYWDPIRCMLKAMFEARGEYGPSEQLIYASTRAEAEELFNQGADPNKIIATGQRMIGDTVAIALTKNLEVIRVMFEHGATNAVMSKSVVCGSLRDIRQIWEDVQRKKEQERVRMENLSRAMDQMINSGADKSGLDEESECPMCLDVCQDNDNTYFLNCGHYYCVSCVKEWFNVRPACPMCGYTIATPPAPPIDSDDEYDSDSDD